MSPRETGRHGRVSPGRFHDQHIHALLRKRGALHQRLVFEIDVPGVKNCAAFVAKQNPDRTEDMAGIKKFERHLRIIIRPFAKQIAAPPDGSRIPGLLAKIHAAVSEERILGDSVILALACHDIDGIMQHHVCNTRRLLGQEDPGLGLAPRENRQPAHMVLMSVRHKNRIHLAFGDQRKIWNRREPFELRMQPGIENQVFSADAQPIGIGADLRAPRQVHQFHSEPTCRTARVCSMKIPPPARKRWGAGEIFSARQAAGFSRKSP